ncbi:Rieske 2Fe-2S domain-containing protein [Ramlibacter sp. AW1]|uniref:Rieske 2Fe-2S domain-containing protein n=1 Tax=Ramlibacter aurantiacus TaxID=2801330 RepID=A0A937D5M5_9BURK|nr:SRPBCC family protein [Ramlibacter aurantiacus]MBL0420068.1 Rieske 2Fe-2S domain-containing protein [Ramlibacter aurantiacus]
MNTPVLDATPAAAAAHRSWPAEGFTRAPYWAYRDPALYALEQERIFRGPHWHYLGLEAEVPERGSYKGTFIGELPVILTRSEDGSVAAVLNRCAHRGNLVVREPFGKTQKLHCVYHSWTFSLKGDLLSVAFRNGLRGEGGLPKDFSMAEHGLRKLRVATICGFVFATFSDDTPPLEEWLGEVADGIRRVCRDKPLKVLGYDTQRIHANWKLYHENPRDSYHANILHTFYGTFGLSRQSQESGMVLDASGRHVYFYTKAGTEKDSADYQQTAAALRSHNAGLALEDTSILKWRDEIGDGVSIQILTTYPSFVLHQIANSLATRQLVPRGPDECDLVWTYFGFADDDEETTRMRLAQMNLVGSAGMVSVEDAAVCEMMMRAIGDGATGESFIEMGGRELDGGGNTKLSERAIRNFWHAYRQDMRI